MSADGTNLSWYVLHTRSRFEKRVVVELSRRGVANFLPLVPRLQQWKDRKKVVWFPLFPGYVFVQAPPTVARSVSSVRGVVRLLGVADRPTSIPDEEIQSVRRLLVEPDRLEPEAYLEVGDLVEVTKGALVGIRGRLLQRHGRRRLVVGVELIRQAVSVEVDAGSVRPLTTDGGRVRGDERHIA